jgi:hypothetical protein
MSATLLALRFVDSVRSDQTHSGDFAIWETLSQQRKTEIAMLIGALQPYVDVESSQEIKNEKSTLFHQVKLYTVVAGMAFSKICSSLEISPDWIQRKDASKSEARKVYANSCCKAYLEWCASSSHEGDTRGLRGAVGMAATHSILGHAAMLKLHHVTAQLGLNETSAVVGRLMQTRATLTARLIEEVKKAIALSDCWTPATRNRVRDIVHAAVVTETDGSNDREMIAEVNKAADALLRGVGFQPLYVVQ